MTSAFLSTINLALLVWVIYSWGLGWDEATWGRLGLIIVLLDPARACGGGGVDR